MTAEAYSLVKHVRSGLDSLADRLPLRFGSAHRSVGLASIELYRE
jgi:hypothetical protein